MALGQCPGCVILLLALLPVWEKAGELVPQVNFVYPSSVLETVVVLYNHF